ncbi:MAG: hypothetical protein HLUCCX14_17660 [Marinobacter excellens HL-55]|uniref:DUF6160 domain-containing protein n=1 Tax=Marinobacter excellens HL-55 TaxID=1305731 RepID=A0A0P8BE84_9GAMM|nr:MAG: hypothetical protein HLUCCX14_17660 [Marinobacter excellens HL-55]
MRCTKDISRSGFCFGLVVGSLVMAQTARADMVQLDDSALSEVQARSGITLEMELNMTADRLSYYDDGQGVHVEGLRVGSASGRDDGAFHRIKADVGADASLNLEYLIEDRRIEFSDIRLAGAPGVSMGGFFFDHSLDGVLTIRQDGGVGGNGYTFDSAYTMTGGRLGYRTNGNSVFLDDITMNVEALGITLDLVGTTLEVSAPRVTGDWRIGGIRYSEDPSVYGLANNPQTGQPLPSFGSFQGSYELSSRTGIRAGGRSGEGLSLDHETTIHTASFIYFDDGNALALRDITGDYQIQDLRVDVAQDWSGRPAVALTLGKLQGNLNVGEIEVGGGSFGSVNLSFLLEDQVFNGQAYGNAIYLQGGGHPDAGAQGLRLATEWSLRLADLSYTEDGHRIIFSGLQSWGRGDVTVNVTRDEVRNGTRFYDGLRIGFDGLSAGYRINGLRVGSDDAQLQGGTELLLALGFYPAYEFELDGHVTLGAGGATGEGLTVNSDIQIRNGKAAVIAAPYDEGAGEIPQKGLWLTEMSYDGQIRDMTMDVTEEGLAIATGEAWSSTDVGNVRVGSKEDGASFGRLQIQKYEVGSTTLVKPGGAGDVCVGGTGSAETTCGASGGQWETRGNEGVTIAMKKILARAQDDNKKNALLWESNRAVDGQGRPINNTGMRLLVNDIYTSDGSDFNGDGVDDNTYGIRTDLSVDVYQTKVTKKTDGPDSLGITGNRGDEKIMVPGSPGVYRYVAEPGPGDRANRPLGFAVKAETRFKELSISNIDLVHPAGGHQTVIYGAKLQNFDIRANLTATPIP